MVGSYGHKDKSQILVTWASVICRVEFFIFGYMIVKGPKSLREGSGGAAHTRPVAFLPHLGRGVALR